MPFQPKGGLPTWHQPYLPEEGTTAPAPDGTRTPLLLQQEPVLAEITSRSLWSPPVSWAGLTR